MRACAWVSGVPIGMASAAFQSLLKLVTAVCLSRPVQVNASSTELLVQLGHYKTQLAISLVVAMYSSLPREI